jgi:ferredoxin
VKANWDKTEEKTEMGDTFRVTIDRDECISCATCWETCPEFFEENPDDGFSQIIEEYRVDDPGAGKALENWRTASLTQPTDVLSRSFTSMNSLDAWEGV